MKDNVCFSFWLPKKDAIALRKSMKAVRDKAKRRTSIAEIVWPSILSFINQNSKGKK